MTSQVMAKRIEQWPIDKLIPFARNARTHSDAQIAQIAASIREFGFTNPILVDSNAGMIAGHGRLLAARQLRLNEVPVIVLDHLSDTQKRAYIIADNRLAEAAGWDDEMLNVELAALQEEGFDVSLVGFDDEELARLLAGQDAMQGLTDEDAVPEICAVPVTVAGDLWILGDHRLLCGEATVRADAARLIAGESADLIFTDPPYNVDYEGYTEARLKIKGDRMTSEQFQQFLGGTFDGAIGTFLGWSARNFDEPGKLVVRHTGGPVRGNRNSKSTAMRRNKYVAQWYATGASRSGSLVATAKRLQRSHH